jgi:hypothetical protein
MVAAGLAGMVLRELLAGWAEEGNAVPEARAV